MAVSRKVDPRASERNRIKRIIRESFRAAHAAVPEGAESGRPQSLDFVVLAAPPAARASNARLVKSLAGHWNEVERKLARAQDGRT